MNIKNLCFITLFIFVWSTATSQDKVTKMTFRMSIEKFENNFDDVGMDITFISSNCNLNGNRSLFLTPTFRLVSAKSLHEVYYQKEEMFITAYRDSCIRGKLTLKTRTKIPKTEFAKIGEEYILIAKLKAGEETYTCMSEPFSLVDINRNLKDKVIPPIFEAYDLRISVDRRSVTLQFMANSNYSMPKIYTRFFLNGRVCSDEVSGSVFTGMKQEAELIIPYTSLYLPPGNHTLTYKVFTIIGRRTDYEVLTGQINITQPQLYWLSFESRNANINVMGMDPSSAIGRAFSKTKGHGLGDAFYRIENEKDILFRSTTVKRSGLIPNQRGRIQTFIDESIVISFWDEDILENDFIEKFSFKLRQNGKQTQSIKSKGKIRTFDFTYGLTPVDKNNYKKSSSLR